MGNCCSGGSTATVEQPVRRAAPPPAVGVCNKVVYPTQSAGDLQVAICSAKWAAHAQERTPAVVKLAAQHGFIALFDGLGQQGDVIAEFCKGAVYEVGLERVKLGHFTPKNHP